MPVLKNIDALYCGDLRCGHMNQHAYECSSLGYGDYRRGLVNQVDGG
jgi:hypothetical protein